MNVYKLNLSTIPLAKKIQGLKFTSTMNKSTDLLEQIRSPKEQNRT